tara:strand:+ start:70 stop:318 length:249 start_codon:yes stop_codon:yes gene_type:complete
MTFTNKELEHLCHVTRVDLNRSKSYLETMKNGVNQSKKRKEPRHITDSHISLRDNVAKKVKEKTTLLTKLENQFFSQGGTFE